MTVVTETVTEPVEAPEAPVDPATPPAETEAPAPLEGVESAAPAEETAATDLQVEVTEPEKPDYMTRADWEREKADVAQRAATEALEADRRRRQTENARKARAEIEQRESDQEAVDTLKAALGAQGIYEVPDAAAMNAINRIASKKAERIATANLDTVEQALDFISAPAYGQTVELDEAAEPAARRLAPKIQHLINTIRPQIEAEARKGYIAESDLPARVEAEIARRAAKGREGQTELARPSGQPAANDTSTVAERLDRIGTSRETPADRQWWSEREKARGR